MKLAISILSLAFAALPIQTFSQESYPKSQGGSLVLPQGAVSFADEVVLFEEGRPHSSNDWVRRPTHAIGAPDHPDVGGNGASVTLGCKGRLVLAFTDNALIDINGPDLHVWEVGPDVEPTRLAISKDATNWIEIGVIQGATASVDISRFVETGDTFRYVSLQDENCIGRNYEYPGADIDAVAAIGTVARIVFDGSVLFAVDKADLTSEAEEVINNFIATLDLGEVAKLEIVGHTDSSGSNAYNLELSQRRADSVRKYLTGIRVLEGLAIEARGAGENEPAASNETAAGRQTNRRVEILYRDD